jgi:2Fe-2S ferredoxin
MPKVHATDRDGTTHDFDAPAGLSLMEALRDTAGLDVAAVCGGNCSCATCHVHVAEEWLDKLPKQAPDEYELVEFSAHYQPNSRLACQIELGDTLDGIAVTLAPED